MNADVRGSIEAVLLNGRAFDGHRYRGECAVALSGDRIVAVGEPDEVRRAVGAGAEQVDLAGGLVSPGFHDAHMHPVVGGLERLWCEMNELSAPEEYLAALREHRADRPDDEWVRGAGWSVDAFGPQGPTAAMLDEVVPDRPAFIPSSDHHNAWVNTRALELAGVSAATPDPVDGWVERDEHGRPTGTLREAAMALVHEHVTTSRQEYYEGLLEAQRHLFSVGITGWHDALLGGYAGLDDPVPAYLDALAAGTLVAAVRGSLWWDRHRGVEQVDDLLRRRAELAEAGLDAGSVKIMVDGITETFTAAVTEPYLGATGCPCGDSGMPFLAKEQLDEAAAAVDAAGFQLHFHAIGDKAVHDALDAVEHARRTNGQDDHRHHIAHLQLVRPEDRRRFADLGVVANLEGMWASEETPAVQMLQPHLDDERLGWHYPFADVVAAGAMVAGGSDWPVNPPDPVSALHVLVNRAAYHPDGQAGAPLVAGQALSLDQAMGAYTRGSAFVNHRPDRGVLRVGARADLAVLDRDPFAGAREEIGAARVVATWVAGSKVHEA